MIGYSFRKNEPVERPTKNKLQCFIMDILKLKKARILSKQQINTAIDAIKDAFGKSKFIIHSCYNVVYRADNYFAKKVFA